MQSFTTDDLAARSGELLRRAVDEPVTVLDQTGPSHVILSAQRYRALVEELEDHRLAVVALEVARTSPMVGADEFTAALRHFANWSEGREPAGTAA